MDIENRVINAKIGNIGLGFVTNHPIMENRLKKHYKHFICNGKGDIIINVKYQKSININPKNIIFHTRSWQLEKKDKRYNIYFGNDGNIYSYAKIVEDLKNIKFITTNPNGQLLMYLSPEVLFSWLLPLSNRLMLHSCGVLSKRKGYLFVAPDGGGKSTIAKLALKEGFEVLNDDRIIIHKQKNRFRMYGTPWHGEVGEVSNKSSYINRVFFLKKAKENKIDPINKINSVSEFYKNSFYLPINNDIMKIVFDAITNIVSNLDCYWFNFKSNKSIWRYLDGYFR